MHDDTISLRQPDAAETRMWFRVLDAAFADEVSDAEYELERIQLEPDRVIGAVEGDAWVGAGAGYSLTPAPRAKTELESASCSDGSPISNIDVAVDEAVDIDECVPPGEERSRLGAAR